MTVTDIEIKEINKNLLEVIKFQKQTIVIQLYNSGATQREIAANLKIGLTTVNRMLSGVKKGSLKPQD